MEDLDYILNMSPVCQGPFLIRAILFYGAKDPKVQPYILIFIVQEYSKDAQYSGS